MILQLLNLNDVSSLRNMCICIFPKKSHLKFLFSYFLNFFSHSLKQKPTTKAYVHT